jgi:hypothetical protein
MDTNTIWKIGTVEWRLEWGIFQGERCIVGTRVTSAKGFDSGLLKGGFNPGLMAMNRALAAAGENRTEAFEDALFSRGLPL